MKKKEVDIDYYYSEYSWKTPDACIIEQIAQSFGQDVEARDDLAHLYFAHLVFIFDEKIYKYKIVEKCEHLGY